MKRLFIILTVVITLLVAVAAIMASAKDDSKIDKLITLGNASDLPRLMVSADSAMAAGDAERALIDYMIICRRTHDSDDAEIRRAGVSAHIKAGDIYFSGGNYSNALDFYLKGLELSENTDGAPQIAELYKNLGNVYNVFKDHEKAIMEYDKGLQYADSASDTEVSLKIYQNMIGTYISLHDAVSARHYYEKSHRIPCSYDVGKFMDRYIHALLLNEEKHYPEAADEFRQVAGMAKSLGLPAKYECSAYEGLYKAYSAMGEQDSTLFYSERCMAFARESGLLHMFSETYRHLADIYDANGNPAAAMRLRSEFLQLQDSIFDIRSFDALKNQRFVYEMNKTEHKINTLHERERHHSEVIRWQRLAIILAAAALIVIGVLMTNLYRKKQKLDASYRNLYQLNKQLMESHNSIVEQKHRQAESAAPAEPPATKYASSRLDEERQTILLDKISRAMEEAQAFCSPEFSLDTLADSVGSNSRYVSQAINEAYGKNFSNYVNEYRVRLACERLADTENYGSLTIRAIGESVGFKSQTTFLTVFKKATGITPSIYLKLSKEEKVHTRSTDS